MYTTKRYYRWENRIDMETASYYIRLLMICIKNNVL